MTVTYSHFGDPEVTVGVSTVVSSYLRLRVNFITGMTNNAALRNPDNYEIVVTLPAVAYDIKPVSVTPESGVTYPTYVDLEVTDCTNGSSYLLVITAGAVEDYTGVPLMGGMNSAPFIGVSIKPAVLYVLPLSLTQVMVVFTKEMSQNEDLFDPTMYVWTGGIRTLKVDSDKNTSVILTTTTQEIGQIYDLTVG